MFKSAVFAFALGAFAASGALAAGDRTYSLSKDKRITTVSQGSTRYAPPSLAPKKDVVFSNVGTKYPKGLYFCCYGNTISGPDAGVGGAYAVALQFTPASDVKSKEVDAGVGWVQGTNSVTISIAEDDGGVPGKTLASGDASGLGTFGNCCTMATADLKASLKGGTPYWVVVTASGNTWAAWSFNSTDQIDQLSAAYSADGGGSWSSGIAIPAPSYQVIGK